VLGVNAEARFNGSVDHVEGSFCLALWENDADAITMGRELLGIPKLFANIEDHTVLDGRWQTSANWRGHDIVRMTACNLSPVPDAQLEEIARAAKEHNWMGWKYIPNTGRSGPAVSHPTVVPTIARPREAWFGAGEVTWKHLTWQQNPTQAHIINTLHDLPMLEYGPAIVTRGAIRLWEPHNPVRELR
jgi:acetoacetate decarboxylase